MKVTGRCYQAYPEFPLLPFDPAAFGFSLDASDQGHARQCPCFTSGTHHLWWNWPDAATREWYAPMDQFFITAGDPFDLDATVAFQTESYTELIRHLLAVPYAPYRPILDIPASPALVSEFFDAMVSGAVIENGGRLNPVVPLVDQAAANAVSRYLQAIESQLGATAMQALIQQSQDNEARRSCDWSASKQQPA